jgi:hypothetical protein
VEKRRIATMGGYWQRRRHGERSTYTYISKELKIEVNWFCMAVRRK